MRVRRAATGIIVVLAVLVVAGGGSASEPASSLRQKRDCSKYSYGEFQKPFSNPGNLHAGPLALVGAGGVAEFTPMIPGQKFPLLVKRGHRVTIAIRRGAADFARLGYGRGHAFESMPRKMTFIACRSEDGLGVSGEGLRPFWSGYVVTHSAGCVPLRIAVAGEDASRHRTIRMGVESCP